jgi:hypothetical protein
MQPWVSLTGLTGRSYGYESYDRYGDWREQPANYAFGYFSSGLGIGSFGDINGLVGLSALATMGGHWVIVYIGEADNIKTRMSSHDRWLDAVALGATHVLAHLNFGSVEARKAEERDLIAHYNPSLNAQHRTNHLAGFAGLGSLGYDESPLQSLLGLPSRRGSL